MILSTLFLLAINTYLSLLILLILFLQPMNILRILSFSFEDNVHPFMSCVFQISHVSYRQAQVSTNLRITYLSVFGELQQHCYWGDLSHVAKSCYQNFEVL